MDTSRRNFILSAAVLAPVVFGGCAATKMLNPISGGTDALLKGLTGSLGGSPTQALGGTAALMNIAKSSLGADKFGSVAQLLPGMDGLLGQAANIPGLGALPTSMAGAASSFQALGLSPSDVGKYGSYITDYLGKNGGGSAAKMLGGVFKP